MRIVFEALNEEAGSTTAGQDSMDEKIPTIIRLATSAEIKRNDDIELEG
jgi:hypothetical protein